MEEFRKSARGQVLVRGALMLVFGLLLNLAITLVGVLAFIQFLLGQCEEKPFPWSSLKYAR